MFQASLHALFLLPLFDEIFVAPKLYQIAADFEKVRKTCDIVSSDCSQVAPLYTSETEKNTNATGIWFLSFLSVILFTFGASQVHLLSWIVNFDPHFHQKKLKL